jgi:hypothetical protein
MNIRTFLLVSLLAFSALATSNGFCDKDLDGIKFFDPDYGIYIITEFNYVDETSFTDSITYTTKKYEHCENGCRPLAEHNAEFIAEERLWQVVNLTTGKKARWSCGAEIRCEDPDLAENVHCSVEKGDCDAEWWEGSPWPYTKIIETYEVDCRGDRSCKYEDKSPDECCIVVSVTKN